MGWVGLAPAKVNLFLHVGPVEADGYHPLVSLVTFADVGDVVTVERAERLSLAVTGPFGAALEGSNARGEGDNLILTALRALGAVAGIGEPGLRVTLDKRLPIAAGLGGGSSDAGAALRLANDVLGLGFAPAGLEDVARVVGADGPMCLRMRTAWAEGRGDVLSDAAEIPPLHAVLVNPGVPSPTGAVYRAYDAAPKTADRPAPPTDWTTGAVIDWLAGCRNDLEAPAIARSPEIATAMTAVEACAGMRLTRMSGSGATVVGLFDGPDAAHAAAWKIRAQHGDWWVEPCVLGGKTAATCE